jgi:hypothetical protein
VGEPLKRSVIRPFPDMTILDRLWALADDVAATHKADVDLLFGECGLFLVRPLQRWEYFCTPLNTLTFATTGGDGVHYGLLQLPGFTSDEQPIVMTVPMSSQHNFVVAESLREFLGLGYFVGWFSLEQLAYNAEEAVSYFARPDVEVWPEKKRELSILREAIPIMYNALSLERIRGLSDKYLSLLALPESTPGG